MSEPPPIGFEVTQELNAHMATYPITPYNQQRLALTPASERANAAWLIKFVSCAVEVAAEMQERYGRGFILGDQTGPLRVWYVRRADIERSLKQVQPEVIAEVKKMVNEYKRKYEGVIVMCMSESVRPMHLTSSGELRSPGSYLRPLLKSQEPIDFPPGVSSIREKTETRLTYTYRSETLGDLGRITVSGFGLQIRFEIDEAYSRENNPLDEQQLELFQGITRQLEQQFHTVFGKPVLDPAWLKETPETLRLYQSFLAVDCPLEMQHLLGALTPEQILTVIRMGAKTLPLAGAHDAEVIRRRLAGLRRLQNNAPTFTPAAQGLYDFVQARSNEEGRQWLLSQADLLLGDEAEREWAAYWEDDPATQAHIESRKRLWETLRRERPSAS